MLNIKLNFVVSEGCIYGYFSLVQLVLQIWSSVQLGVCVLFLGKFYFIKKALK